jgi:IS5 family transposase
MKPTKSHLFFSETDYFKKVMVSQNRLIDLKERIDFEPFKSVLNQQLNINEFVKQSASKWEPLFLFKCLLLGIIFDYSDEELEYQLINRADFKVFLDLELMDNVPDKSTLWLFRESLVNSNSHKPLFDSYLDQIKLLGYSFKDERIVDGTVHETEHRCTSHEVDEKIKSGHVPEEWAKNPNILCQNDLTASWRSEGKKRYFGYLALIIVLSKYKFITNYAISPAHIDERKNVVGLVENEVHEFIAYADKGFVSQELKTKMNQKGVNFIAMEKEYLLSEDLPEVEKSNKAISKIRARVEHVFGNITMMMPQRPLRLIGIERNTFKIGMMYMLHNMFRLISIENSF